jgi:hypothetical protein
MKSFQVSSGTRDFLAYVPASMQPGGKHYEPRLNIGNTQQDREAYTARTKFVPTPLEYIPPSRKVVPQTPQFMPPARQLMPLHEHQNDSPSDAMMSNAGLPPSRPFPPKESQQYRPQEQKSDRNYGSTIINNYLSPEEYPPPLFQEPSTNNGRPPRPLTRWFSGDPAYPSNGAASPDFSQPPTVAVTSNRPLTQWFSEIPNASTSFTQQVDDINSLLAAPPSNSKFSMSSIGSLRVPAQVEPMPELRFRQEDYYPPGRNNVPTGPYGKPGRQW